MGLLLEHFLL